MDIKNRKWWILVGDIERGPISEDDFQEELRSGKISLRSQVKSNYMDNFEPLLKYVSTDESFRRPSTMPPSLPDNSES